MPSTRATPTSIWELPRVPAVYALYGGRSGSRAIAYVAAGDVLLRRVLEQLVIRDPLHVLESPALALMTSHVTEIRWWEHSAFAQRHALLAAELVACDLFDPPLTGRSRASAQSFALYGDARFRESMRSLLRSEPRGRLVLPTVEDTLDRLAELEHRVTALERAAGLPVDRSAA